jgi:threonine dehydrogenase-like Zn-dependent dehydrogenase
VLVRTLRSGISSGTELLCFRGQLDPDLPLDERIGSLGGTFRFPFPYGYSCVGEVERAGGSVPRGSLVFAFHPHQERFVASGADLVRVGGLDPRLATVLPYVETALQITLDAGPLVGETVVVSGLGALGLLVSLLVERAGGRVVGIEPLDWRRNVAVHLGLTAVDPGYAVEAIAGSDVPVAIECSGNPDALALMLEVLAQEGTVLVASWYGSKPVSLALGGRFHRRRLTIRSTQVSTIPAALSGRWSHRRRLLHALELASTLPLDALATDTIPFDRASEGYARVDAAPTGLIHMAFGYG